MKHVLEFNSYRDDAGKNVPKELLYDEEQSVRDSNNVFSNLGPRLRNAIQYIFTNNKSSIEETVLDLDLSDEEINKIEDALFNLHEIFIKVSKIKSNKN